MATTKSSTKSSGSTRKAQRKSASAKSTARRSVTKAAARKATVAGKSKTQPPSRKPATTDSAASRPVAIPPARLEGKSKDELDRIFSELPEPASQSLSGVYSGRILAGGLLEPLLPVARDSLIKVAAAFWRGKSFSGASGSNIWFDLQRGLRLVSYDLRVGRAHDSRGKVIQLDYDRSENLPPLRLILGEARSLGDGAYLARMLFKVRNDWFNVIYFTLIPA